MTISIEGTGTLATHTDSITPSFPAGDPTAGRLAVLQVVSGHPDDDPSGDITIEPFTPTGWDIAGSVVNADPATPTGTYGVDDGPRRLTWFVKVLDGNESDPTTFIDAGGTDSFIAGRIMTFSRSTGTVWRYIASIGADIVDSTAFSTTGGNVACSPDLTFSTDDLCVLGYAVNDDTSALSAEAISATGVTFGTVTEQVDDAITTGADARLGIATCFVTSGSTTAATPEPSATLAVAGSGPLGVLKIREEAETAITLVEQTVFPPRVQISVSGMLGEQVDSLTVYREVDSIRTVVRALDGFVATGLDAAVRVDGEFPFGKSITYVAEFTDSTGIRFEEESSPITVNVNDVILSDAILGIGVGTRIYEWTEKHHSREYSKFVVGNGRVVIVSSGDRQLPSSTLVLRVDTDNEREDLDTLLQQATAGTILIRQPGQFEDIDAYVVVLEDTNIRINPKDASEPMRLWQMEVQEVTSWTANLEAAGFTIQDIEDAYEGGTFQDLADDFFGQTLLDVATFDWGA